MAAFSLRGLDEKVAAKLRAQAKRQGVSVNALLQQFTRQGLGLQPTRKRVVYDDLDAQAGTWNDVQAAEFLRAIEDFERVDEESWR